MPPQIALLAYSVALFFFLRYDSKDSKPPLALWIPVIWMFFMGSRTPSQWFGDGALNAAPSEDGSPLDRGIFLALEALTIVALARLRVNWSAFITRNVGMMLLLTFALLSFIWSDYPGITFKRWGRDLGTYLMVVLVLAQPRPLDAIATVIRRMSALLLVLSMLLIKYYPETGVFYNYWSGAPEYAGATTSKNMLGAACLIGGIFFLWDLLRRWPERKTPGAKPMLYATFGLIAVTLWILKLIDSATSTVCLGIGIGVMVLLRGKWAKAHPRTVSALIPLGLVTYIVLESAFDMSASIAVWLGRDPTLHGRTGIWDTLLDIETNPLVGVGYQSFWLGDRMDEVQRRLNTTYLNEAHNGYLETYLSLGFVGLTLLVGILVSCFLRLSKQLQTSQPYALLGLSLWSLMVVYNVTEAAFPASLLWTVFLFFGIAPLAEAQMAARHNVEALDQRRAPGLQRQTGLAARGRASPGAKRPNFTGVRTVGR
jgi:O-antigen ligase